MEKRTLVVGLVILAVIAVAVTATLFLTHPASFRGAVYVQPLPAADFALMRDNGEIFQLSGQRGKVVLLFFGFTYCPDVCPTTLAKLKQVYDAMGNQGHNLQVVFVTVDPARDTPQKIQQYVDRFNSSFIGLSGSQTDLEKIWNDYGIYREIVPGNSPTNYDVTHTARITLIDAAGNMRLSYGYDVPVDDMVHDIKLLLK